MHRIEFCQVHADSIAGSCLREDAEMGATELSPWSITATNLPEHARNPIHTDDGGRAAGFPGALVAGVTVYAYLCHVPLVAFGAQWVTSGACEVRFRRPVFDNDLVCCEPATVEGDAMICAMTEGNEQPRATLTLLDFDQQVPDLRNGDDLDDIVVHLNDSHGSDYALRAGDELDLCTRLGLVHPAVWPDLGNQVMHTQLARGSWVHTRSIIRHHAAVEVGAIATVSSRVVNRFFAHGERAVIDVHIRVGDTVVASLEHEAIIDLTATGG